MKQYVLKSIHPYTAQPNSSDIYNPTKAENGVPLRLTHLTLDPTKTIQKQADHTSMSYFIWVHATDYKIK
jgi:hypothetical protein